jgi:hypothetical protein
MCGQTTRTNVRTCVSCAVLAPCTRRGSPRRAAHRAVRSPLVHDRARSAVVVIKYSCEALFFGSRPAASGTLCRAAEWPKALTSAPQALKSLG